MFVPSNVPKILLPFLVVIEVISHLAKIFSLAIRLFANMMSGHVLLHILTGFVLDLAKTNLLFILFPVILIMSIVLLEYGIAFLQAYVFVTLLAIYFEEHFGFSQDYKNEIYQLISINGKKINLVKINFFTVDYIKIQYYNKCVFYFITNRRTYRGKIRRSYLWVYSHLGNISIKFKY